MTHWLISRTDRFRAAVAANGVTNQISAAANCDLGASGRRASAGSGRRPTSSASGGNRRWPTPSAS